MCGSASSYSASVAPSDNTVELDSDQLGVEFWKTKYDQLEEHCKVVNEQKVTIIVAGICVDSGWVRHVARHKISQLADVLNLPVVWTKDHTFVWEGPIVVGVLQNQYYEHVVVVSVQ